MESSRSRQPTEAVRAAVAGCLERHVRAGDTVVVGLSGGVDSMVLLHALAASGVPLSALHVHHGLSANADSWESFCRGVCQALAVPLRVQRVSVERESAAGLECAARKARHQAFADTDGDWVALGHHAGDQAETVLFNLLRGAGVRGAAAMTERHGRLLRPLLGVRRNEILAYARNHDLAWVDDESNADLRYSRNFLRHRVLRELVQRFPGAEGNLAAAAKRFAEAQTWDPHRETFLSPSKSWRAFPHRERATFCATCWRGAASRPRARSA
jgi:tRNA(Ile)-lysidine synthase